MRGAAAGTESLFGYVGGEARVLADGPLRPIRAVVDKAPQAQSGALERLFVPLGRPSRTPGQVLRAWLQLQVISVRSEQQPMVHLGFKRPSGTARQDGLPGAGQRNGEPARLLGSAEDFRAVLRLRRAAQREGGRRGRCRENHAQGHG
jgi:hypothetical protein